MVTAAIKAAWAIYGMVLSEAAHGTGQADRLPRPHRVSQTAASKAIMELLAGLGPDQAIPGSDKVPINPVSFQQAQTIVEAGIEYRELLKWLIHLLTKPEQRNPFGRTRSAADRLMGTDTGVPIRQLASAIKPCLPSYLWSPTHKQ